MADTDTSADTAQRTGARPEADVLTAAQILETFPDLRDLMARVAWDQPISHYATPAPDGDNSVLQPRPSGLFRGTASADIINDTDADTLIVPGGGADQVNLAGGVNLLFYYEGHSPLYKDQKDEIRNLDPRTTKIIVWRAGHDSSDVNPAKEATTVREATSFSGDAREWIYWKVGDDAWEARYTFSGRNREGGSAALEDAIISLKIHGPDDLSAGIFMHYPNDFDV